MKMVPLPSGLGTCPLVHVSFFSFLSRDWMHLSSTRRGKFNMVNGSLIQQLLGQIKPGSETEQASPTGMIWLGPKDLAPFCYFTVSVTHHVVQLLLSSFVSSSIHLISICRLESFEGSMVVSRFISKFGCKALLSQHKKFQIDISLIWFLALITWSASPEIVQSLRLLARSAFC